MPEEPDVEFDEDDPIEDPAPGVELALNVDPLEGVDKLELN